MRPTAAQMAASLGLEPHPEGGYYLETYRAAQTLRTPRGERPASTAIVFLITAESVSRLHRLASDELWVYQGGLPLELVTIATGGELERRLLGDPVEIGRRDQGHRPTDEVPAGPPEGSAGPAECSPRLLPQALVPAGSWQGARLAVGPHLPADRAWALVSCVVTPGFDFEDFELGEREALLAAFPQYGDLVRELT
jgi:predicted cupin superfamily sugar epimerase